MSRKNPPFIHKFILEASSRPGLALLWVVLLYPIPNVTLTLPIPPNPYDNRTPLRATWKPQFRSMERNCTLTGAEWGQISSVVCCSKGPFRAALHGNTHTHTRMQALMLTYTHTYTTPSQKHSVFLLGIICKHEHLYSIYTSKPSRARSYSLSLNVTISVTT